MRRSAEKAGCKSSSGYLSSVCYTFRYLGSIKLISKRAYSSFNNNIAPQISHKPLCSISLEVYECGPEQLILTGLLEGLITRPYSRYYLIFWRFFLVDIHSVPL